jgi:hypothetical protein
VVPWDETVAHVMNPRIYTPGEVLLTIGNVNERIAKVELICIGPSKRYDEAVSSTSGKAFTMVLFALGSPGSGSEVCVYVKFGYNIGG